MAQKIDRRVLEQRILEVEGLSSEEQSALLELLHTKKYGLVWEDKPEDVEERLRESLPVLIEDKELALVEGGEDAPNHILIEGDNLEALTALTYTHEGKIDVIYIDPPYNTKNKDFVYNDKFVDYEDEYRHSKWLSFMSKRLRISKRLLSDKGVIFISIDDNEQANLKLLCDEVFGEGNLLGPIVQDKLNAKNDTLNIQKNHEYILCYRKKIIVNNGEEFPHINVKVEIRKEVYEEHGEYYYLNDSITTRGKGGTLNARPNLGYTFYFNPTTNDIIPKADYNIELAKISNDKEEVYTDDLFLCQAGYIPIRPPQVRGKLGCWTWDVKKAMADKHYLFVRKTKNRYNIIKRTFIPKENINCENGKYYYTRIKNSNSRSIIQFSTNDGSNVLTSILGEDAGFNNPKNVDMIEYFIQISSSPESTILDFFAGSGTTLHATMQLNAEDGGKRQCILVTNNENNICRDVTYERNKRVINGYTTPKGVEVEGLKGNNLRYYRTEFVDRDSSMTNKRKLMASATELLCIKHDIYEEVHTFGELKLKPHIARYFEEKGKKMLIVYKVEYIEYLVKEIAQMPADTHILIYVFSINNYAMDADFEDVADKVKLCALPAAIYNAYLKVLPKKKSEVAVEESEEKSNEESL